MPSVPSPALTAALVRSVRSPGRATAVVRVGAGAVMLARPSTVEQVLGSRTPATAWAVRLLGGREVALGLAVLVSSDRVPLLAGALSDGTDAVVLGRALRDGAIGRTAPTRLLATLCTAGAVAASAAQVLDAIRTSRTARGATTPADAPRD